MEQKVVQKAPEQAKKPAPNLTGIPTQMKLDFERRSGLSFDDVRVHYNSDKPRKIGALAYTQLPQVHIGPGQERHLRHELGHVVQQKQGIVRPTSMQGGLKINESTELERSADNILNCSVKGGPIYTKHGPAIIQKKGVNVSVSLIPHEIKDKAYSANEVLFQHLSLYGRSETDLGSQGDHTVADILVKKAQKEAVTGHSITNAISFYQQMTDNLNQILQDCFDISPGEVLRNAVPKNNEQQHALELLECAVSESRMLEALVHREALNNLFRSPNLYTKHKLTYWTALLKNIIYEYNEYYAHSPFATFGVGSGGHGEAQAIKEAKRWRDDILHQEGYATPASATQDMSKIRETARLARLFDYDSAFHTASLVPLYIKIDNVFREKCKYIMDGLGFSGTEKKPDDRLYSDIQDIVIKQTITSCPIPLINFVDHLYLVLSSKDTASKPYAMGAIDFRKQQKIASSQVLSLIPYKAGLVLSRYKDYVEPTTSAPAAVPKTPTTQSTKSGQHSYITSLRGQTFVRPRSQQVPSSAPPQKRARIASSDGNAARRLRKSVVARKGKRYDKSSLKPHMVSQQRLRTLKLLLIQQKINQLEYNKALMKAVARAYK